MANSPFDALLQDLAQKDFLTYQHSIAVAEHMRNLAKALNLGEEGETEAEIIGAIHDLSKTQVDGALFRKLQSGETLSKEERTSLHQPPEKLFELINKDMLPVNVQKAIPQLECRFDGKGVPAVKGSDIELLSRMLIIINYYDMLTRQRPGKTPLSEEQSRQLLKVQSGKLFDPELVEKFLSTLG